MSSIVPSCEVVKPIALFIEAKDLSSPFSLFKHSYASQILDLHYTIYTAPVSSLSEMQKAIDETAAKGVIGLLRIYAHGSPDCFKLGDSKDDGCFVSYRAFTGEYEGLFAKIDRHARIILHSCSNAKETWLEKFLEGQEVPTQPFPSVAAFIDKLTISGKKSVPSEICYSVPKEDITVRFTRAFNGIFIEKIDKNEKVIAEKKVKSLNVLNAIAWLAPGRVVYAPSQDSYGTLQVTSINPLQVRFDVAGNQNTSTVICVVDEEVSDLKITPGGVAFEIEARAKKRNRITNVHILSPKKTSFKEFLRLARQDIKVIWV